MTTKAYLRVLLGVAAAFSGRLPQALIGRVLGVTGPGVHLGPRVLSLGEQRVSLGTRAVGGGAGRVPRLGRRRLA